MPTINVLLDESQLSRDLANLKRELKSLLVQIRNLKWRLIAVNEVMEDIVRKKRKYTRKVAKPEQKLAQKETCSKCSGTGIINVDKAGIIARYCDCEAGQRKLAEKKRIFDK